MLVGKHCSGSVFRKHSAYLASGSDEEEAYRDGTAPTDISPPHRFRGKSGVKNSLNGLKRTLSLPEVQYNLIHVANVAICIISSVVTRSR